MKKLLPLVIGIVAFALLMLGVFTFDFSQLTARGQTQANSFTPGKTKGNVNAFVEMIELSDFQ